MNNSNSYRYDATPDAYLERAKKLLQKCNAASLFYAAYELRCFVEARQDLYLDAQREYARSVPKRWKIGAQGKTLERIFESNKIQNIKWHFKDEQVFDAYHIPVSNELRKRSEKLGGLLHARGIQNEPDEVWWIDTRKNLLEIYEMAWLCNCGTLLSPMFLHKGMTVGKMMIKGSNGISEKLKSSMKKGAVGTMEVSYPEKLPEDWKSDIS